MMGSWLRRRARHPIVVRATTVILLLGLVGLVALPSALADAPALATLAADAPLRATPSEDGAVLATVPAGAEVQLTGATAIGFLEATVDGRTGWIAANALIVSNQVGIPLAEAAVDTPILAAPLVDAEVLGTIPAGGVAILTGAHVGSYVAASYDGVGGWVAESDLGLPYDADGGGW